MNFSIMIPRKVVLLGLCILMQQMYSAPQPTWTFFVYMVRDNSLSDFGTKNIEAMKAVNNPNVNIIVFDCHKLNGVKEAQMLQITHNTVTVLETIPNLDGGSNDNFISALLYAIQHFPSDKLAIIAWDHGSGMLNRGMRIPLRGFCYDDTTGNHLDDIGLMQALQQVVHARNGKLVDIFGFDACLMADAEMVAAVAPYASFLVASQQTIPGNGWDYQNLLSWKGKVLSPADFAKQIVKTYGTYYTHVQESFTLSAADCTKWQPLNAAISSLATQLTKVIASAANPSAVIQTLVNCTNAYFEEPTYMDIIQFCKTLSAQINTLGVDSTTAQQLKVTLNSLQTAVKNVVVANAKSNDLNKATGLSIYFPQELVEPSYANTYFAQQSTWPELIAECIPS